MLDTVDSFALIEFAFDFKEVICETLATYLVGQPDVFCFIKHYEQSRDFEDSWEFNRVNRVPAVSRVVVSEEQSAHFNFDLGSWVQRASTLDRMSS